MLALWGQDAEIDLYPGRFDFSRPSLRFVFVLWARAKLNRAIAVVVAFHREAADAFAVFAAFEVVPGDITEVLVHSVLLKLVIVQLVRAQLEPCPNLPPPQRVQRSQTQ